MMIMMMLLLMMMMMMMELGPNLQGFGRPKQLKLTSLDGKESQVTSGRNTKLKSKQDYNTSDRFGRDEYIWLQLMHLDRGGGEKFPPVCLYCI